MRYVWDRYEDYFGPERLGRVGRLVIPHAAAGLRTWDAASAERVHVFAANSAYVAARIRRYYGREAEVIPPPVDTELFTPGPDRPGTYDLVVSALAPYKRLELALEAYRGSGWPLRIVGTGPEDARLRPLAPSEVEFLGHVSDTDLRDLYRGCRAVLMPGVEDFGIAPLEAMACGRPAVVYGEGGGLESVEDGRTGVVFTEPTAAALRDALATLSSTPFDRLALRARAEAHRREVFETRIRRFVERAQATVDPAC
jgi:glycosyltransferase involved in cell wall biosynthesis